MGNRPGIFSVAKRSVLPIKGNQGTKGIQADLTRGPSWVYFVIDIVLNNKVSSVPNE